MSDERTLQQWEKKRKVIRNIMNSMQKKLNLKNCIIIFEDEKANRAGFQCAGIECMNSMIGYMERVKFNLLIDEECEGL